MKRFLSTLYLWVTKVVIIKILIKYYFLINNMELVTRVSLIEINYLSILLSSTVVFSCELASKCIIIVTLYQSAAISITNRR